METDFCIEAVEEALLKYGKPEISAQCQRHCRDNTDQGSQFTSVEFTNLIKANDIKISMDGNGAWRDNVFVERIWHSIKYEEIYLHAYTNVKDARTAIVRYLAFYNGLRPHSSLDRRTPDEAYFKAPQPIPAAA